MQGKRIPRILFILGLFLILFYLETFAQGQGFEARYENNQRPSYNLPQQPYYPGINLPPPPVQRPYYLGINLPPNYLRTAPVNDATLTRGTPISPNSSAIPANIPVGSSILSTPLGISTTTQARLTPRQIETITLFIHGLGDSSLDGNRGPQLNGDSGMVRRFNWSGSIFDTRTAIKDFAAQIIAASSEAQLRGARLNIIGYSWGATIAYYAIKKVGNENGIKVDNFMTFGSPLPFHNKPGNVSSWTNFLSWRDPISWLSRTSSADRHITVPSARHWEYWGIPMVTNSIERILRGSRNQG